MPVDKCRVCGNSFFDEPLLKYKNMPKSAQYFPDAATLHLDKGVNMTVCQCSACGLVQLSNDPVPYFREVIRAAGISKEMTDFRRTQFRAFVEKYTLRQKKAIEIGCGHGEYLSILETLDLDSHGLEYAEEAVNLCREKGLKVSQGFIDSRKYPLDNAPFSVFLILNFLEHLPAPNTTLAGIWHNLKDGGIGIVEVPNFDMMLKNDLFTEFISDHLFYFTKETLTTTLALNGFELLDCSTIWYDYIISAQVRKRAKINLSRFDLRRSQLENELHTYIDGFKPKTVAIWGAGHQALAIMSMLNLAEKIRFVIDSASFKQERYTPATHIEIVPPEALDCNNIQAIIIMAGSYSDEVADIVKKRYGRRTSVAVLRGDGLQIVDNDCNNSGHDLE
ncbi:MAG: methyltransferase domain-containing protein [Thermodesulfobacteriota bacterium]|jgi:2-polyprenyl-3-methyl-5-hydroxy-6-metoxy-1,4-benzoquinol methylase|nr:methyltransferase domain-containing protein [Thermodesulfobacteriota bacterium]